MVVNTNKDNCKVTIKQGKTYLDKYDMYFLNFKYPNGSIKTIKVFTEKGTFPNIHSNEFKELQKKYREQIRAFFSKRLFGENGLMLRQGRGDYIYLGGDFLKNGQLANRYIIQENGRTGQEVFNKNLMKLKMQVEADLEMERNDGNIFYSNKLQQNNGKHYVIADIHGMYGSYMDVVNKLRPQDTLYIIGDVIDRGTGGIKIIQDIMNRQNNIERNPNIIFMMGNHEMQFLDQLNTINKYGLTAKDVQSIMIHNSPKFSAYYNLKEYYKMIEEKKIDRDDIIRMGIWLNPNKASTTIFDFLEGGLVKGDKERQKIVDFLRNSYVALPQNINNRDYLLVHAMPPKDIDMVDYMKRTGNGYKFSELTPDEYQFMLEQREKDGSSYEQCASYGFTTICGHTPTPGTIVNNPRRGFIRLDAGCGHNNGKLALYCIEDESVQYINAKENNYSEYRR